jgi:hypothetical protein
MKSAVSVTSLKRKIKGLGWRVCTLSVLLGVLVLTQTGCKSWSQPGQTGAEVNRRHKRILRANAEMMMADVDMVLGLDKPSALTDRRLP